MRRLVLISLLLPAAAWADASLDPVEWEFLEILNQYRAENGLDCLTPSPTLNAAADYMSRAMGEQDFFSHNEPPCDPAGPGEITRHDCHGREVSERVQSFGHMSGIVGENIAAGHGVGAREAFEMWRNSPGHNANMLHPAYKAIGIGRVAVPGSAYQVYWTNNFSDHVDGNYAPCGEGRGDGGGGAGNGNGGAGSDEGKKDFWEKAEEDEKGGGCNSAGGSAGGLAFLTALLWLRRRAA